MKIKGVFFDLLGECPYILSNEKAWSEKLIYHLTGLTVKS